MAIGPQSSLPLPGPIPGRYFASTDMQCVQFARTLAENAEATLRRRSVDGPKARPSLADINATLERLESIQRLLTMVLEG